MAGYPPLQGIPPPRTRPPVEWSLRCLCGRRFVVFDPSGPVIGAAEDRARERATQMRATFVNAGMHRFAYCGDCGQLLIFDESFEVVESAMVQ